jgi:hypothetical protein
VNLARAPFDEKQERAAGSIRGAAASPRRASGQATTRDARGAAFEHFDAGKASSVMRNPEEEPMLQAEAARARDGAASKRPQPLGRAHDMSGHAIHITVDGRKYAGTFTVDRKLLTVSTTYGKKTAEVNPRVQHQALAHQLLQELVKEEKARKGSTL